MEPGEIRNQLVYSHGGLAESIWGSLHTRAKSHDGDIVRAQKKVSIGRPKTPPNACSVVMDSQVSCEAICDQALNQMPVQCFSIYAGSHTW